MRRVHFGGPLPEPGGRISATGFPETDTFFLHLDNAAWTPAQGCPLPRAEPENVSIDALMKNDNGMPHVDVHSNGRSMPRSSTIHPSPPVCAMTALIASSRKPARNAPPRRAATRRKPQNTPIIRTYKKIGISVPEKITIG